MSALLQQPDEDACRLLRLVERIVNGAPGGVLDLAAAEHLLALALRHHRELTVQHVGELVGGAGARPACRAGGTPNRGAAAALFSSPPLPPRTGWGGGRGNEREED